MPNQPDMGDPGTQNPIHNALALQGSMVSSGEQHSERSRAAVGAAYAELERLQGEVEAATTDALLWGEVSKVLTANGFAPQHLADIPTAVDQWLKGLKLTTEGSALKVVDE